MSGWGLTLLGLGEVLDTLNDIRARWEGDTLYLVGPTVEYAIYQERGTSKMEARPFMAPAARNVRRSPEVHIRRIMTSIDADLSSEAGLVKATALAVQTEAKRIADLKGIRDTGQLIASITIQRVQ